MPSSPEWMNVEGFIWTRPLTPLHTSMNHNEGMFIECL